MADLPPVMADLLGARLMELTAMLRKITDDRMTGLPLTPAQWRPLWMIQLGVADTVLALSRALSIDAGAVTRLVDRLVAKGLVERHRVDEDRRVVRLRVTAAAVEALADVPARVQALNQALLTGFSADERRRLMEALARVRVNAKAMVLEN